jgi:hypothetical protein
VFPAIITNLALPERNVFFVSIQGRWRSGGIELGYTLRVDLYPRTTGISCQFAISKMVLGSIPLPLFMTKARRELMLSAVFLDFFVGAIAALF